MSDLTDQQKSVLLAKAMGWEYYIGQHDKRLHIQYRSDDPTKRLLPQNGELYDPANMHLAWRVLNWACFNEGISRYLDYNSNPHSDYPLHILMAYMDEHEIVIKPPAYAQRLWLDKIFKLAVEAGIIEVEK